MRSDSPGQRVLECQSLFWEASREAVSYTGGSVFIQLEPNQPSSVLSSATGSKTLIGLSIAAPRSVDDVCGPTEQYGTPLGQARGARDPERINPSSFRSCGQRGRKGGETWQGEKAGLNGVRNIASVFM